MNTILFACIRRCRDAVLLPLLCTEHGDTGGRAYGWSPTCRATWRRALWKKAEHCRMIDATVVTAHHGDNHGVWRPRWGGIDAARQRRWDL